jgi:hypothetical protein
MKAQVPGRIWAAHKRPRPLRQEKKDRTAEVVAAPNDPVNRCDSTSNWRIWSWRGAFSGNSNAPVNRCDESKSLGTSARRLEVEDLARQDF